MIAIASTEAAVGVGPGAGWASLLSPLQRRPGRCFVSVRPLTLWPSVRIGPSKRVSVFPSIRTFTSVGAACAAANEDDE